MVRQGFAIILAAAALAGCGGKPAGVADTAHQLLAASAAGDRVAFEAVIDRAAVRDDLRRQIVERGRQSGLEVDGGPSDFALDRMIGPSAVKLVAGAAVPAKDELAPRMKSQGDKRACLVSQDDAGRCVLTFARSKAGWRLVGMQAVDLRTPLA